jgi:hypothetical protein
MSDKTKPQRWPWWDGILEKPVSVTKRKTIIIREHVNFLSWSCGKHIHKTEKTARECIRKQGLAAFKKFRRDPNNADKDGYNLKTYDEILTGKKIWRRRR